jgi:hypothetical protein
VHYFGSFAEKKAAVAWIDAHAWLTVPTKPPSDSLA